jgi:peptidoglycan hydrolase CwlO-like protein
MPIFKCVKCNYTTTKKHHLKQHINKKNPCKTEIVYSNELKEQINNETDNEIDNEIDNETDNELLELLEENENLYDEIKDLAIKINELREKDKTNKKKISSLEKIINSLGYELEY